MESHGQDHGFILYRTRLVGHRGGKLTVTELHDYGSVFVDGRFVGTIDRTRNESSVDIPTTEPAAERLGILVEGMGRINYGPRLLDRKGITERVTLNNMTLMVWDVYRLPMDGEALGRLTELAAQGAVLVHAYDDPLVMAGQGTIGLEIREDLPSVDQVIVPVGGGGLIAGITTALRGTNPGVRLTGVQAAACPSAVE